MTETTETIRPTPPQVPWLPIMIGVAVVAVLLAAGFAVWRMQVQSAADDTYVVELFTPPSELISASERVRGHDTPDASAPVAVEFGEGVTLNVTGRVARGIGNDWYAVAWNERTVFVRVSDTRAGSGAPPEPIVRERPPEPVIVEEEKPDPLGEDSEPVTQSPFTPSSGVLSMGDVNWIRAPSARDFARFYPEAALNRGVSGNVTLDCIIGGGGRLACSVAGESPGGFGFGRAAINISRQLRVGSTLTDGSPAAGRNLRVPLSFRAG
ncbi:MAG: energy transducer TonB [Hyphomonadaceae bacterium]|nr:energy transducer TonB [Hyphomonadaceae bacterium]